MRKPDSPDPEKAAKLVLVIVTVPASLTSMRPLESTPLSLMVQFPRARPEVFGRNSTGRLVVETMAPPPVAVLR